MNPVVIARNKQEKVLIEGSVNSIRVSVSLKKLDELDQILSKRFMRFLTQRAEHFLVLRRKPVKVHLTLTTWLETCYAHCVCLGIRYQLPHHQRSHRIYVQAQTH